MKIMISAVGNRDPFPFIKGSRAYDENSEGAVITAFNHFQPDVVYLIYTSSMAGTRQNAEDTKSYIDKYYNDGGSNIHLLPMENRSVDYPYIIREFSEKLKMIYSTHERDKAEYYTVISSGTPQMKGAWILLDNNRLIKGELYQVIERRFAASENERVQKIDEDLSFLSEIAYLEDVKDLVNQFFFAYASDEMKKLALFTLNPSRKILYIILSDCFDAFNAQRLNVQNYKRYEDKILKVLKDFDDPSLNVFDQHALNAIKDSLQKQLHAIKALKKALDEERENESFLFELYNTARKKFINDDYISAFSIVWRLYEGILNFMLFQRGVNVYDLRDINTSKLLESLGITERGYLTLKNLEHIMSKRFPEDYKRVQAFNVNKRGDRDTRNESILAHGFEGVSQGEMEAILRKIEKVMDDAFAIGSYQSYAFDISFVGLYSELLDDLIVQIE